MIEFFGNERGNSAEAQVHSAEFAKISLNSGDVSLVQSLQATYGRQLRPIGVVGDSNVYFASSAAQGSAQMGRLTGKDGFFAPFKTIAANCGRVSTLQVSAHGGRCTTALGSSGMTWGGGMMESVGVQVSMASPEIVESSGFRFATLRLN